jgi:protein-L-isoaspartate(D-aspartate) O-methyltransferase
VTAWGTSSRDRLASEIIQEFHETAGYTGRSAPKPATLRAIESVDRRRFVPEEESSQAYIDRPLSIGHGQTISQPFIVALMTDLLDISESSRVLEIGTGSGYQAAILGEIADQVFSIEIIAALAHDASEVLSELGYENITVKCDNGRLGWPEHAPYDGIIVTAAAEAIPPALTKQLAPGGNLVIPVSTGVYAQSLKRIHRDVSGTLEEEDILPVVFVPLTGKAEQIGD